MTPEAKVKKKVVNVLKSYGAYYFYPVTGGFGRSGIPDIVACYLGQFIGIECKAGSNKPTALQEAEMEKIKKAEGIAFVVNEDNIEEVNTVLDFIKDWYGSESNI
jgi:Holliday junction resolvase